MLVQQTIRQAIISRHRILLVIGSFLLLLFFSVQLQLVHPEAIWMLGILLLFLEWFPVGLGRINFSLCFPLFFGLFFMLGPSMTLWLDAFILLLVQAARRKPWEVFSYNFSSRMIALALSGWFWLWANANVIQEGHKHLIIDSLWLLMVTALIYSTSANLLILLVWRQRRSWRVSARLFLSALGIDLGLATLYNGLMIWLASNPVNVHTGSIGSFFFFLPLVAISLVAHLVANLLREKHRLESVFSITESIRQPNHLDSVLPQIANAAKELFRSSFGVIYQVDEWGLLYREMGNKRYTLPRGQGISGWAVQTGRLQMVADVERDSRFLPQEADKDIRSLFVAPIYIDEQVVGVITLGKPIVNGFHPQDEKLMTLFSSYASVAMRNALYLEEQKRRILLEERNRLAREIHDGIAQNLAGALLRVESILRHSEPAMQKQLLDLQKLLQETVGSVRSSIYSLRPQPYVEQGLEKAIRNLLKDLLEDTEIQVEFSVHQETNLLLHPEISRTVYEMIAEGTRNMRKHAHARHFKVRLDLLPDRVKVLMLDDGCGFHFARAIQNAIRGTSFGIDMIHQMAAQWKGRVEYITSPGSGTEIWIELPIGDEVEENVHSSAFV
ncbi:GAF domain-containing sensor histidine kinase [Alicyclobacillus tolerans]|uniref:GAF domain-containing sensor histidine kinase n=1 Tax=Alicyclobacillus tolerans TaxID=90970 RepID=UPI003B82AD00